MQVNFNDIDEFLNELHKDAAEIERGIVRVTQRARHAPAALLVHLSIVATARLGDTVLRLDVRCDDLTRFGAEYNDKVNAHARNLQEKLETGINSLGLEVRAGILSDREPPC